MKHNVIQLHIYLITLLSFLFLSHHVFAFELTNYKITDAQQFIGDPYLPTILYHTTIPVPWKSGKVLLAANPDGTGTADVGVQLEVYGSDLSKRFIYEGGCEEKPMPPLDITHLMGPKYPHLGPADSQVFIRYNRLMCANWIKENNVAKMYFDISPLYLVHFDDEAEQKKPFLRLPWDYQSNGMSFGEAVLNIYSWFDHQYPLLSTTLREPPETIGDIIRFDGSKANLYYSSHDGYDWARAAGIALNTPVLAAADGAATYKQWGNCGNMIMVDHDNGFQTRYCHLSSDDLITTGTPVPVTAGQMIGRVGMTGKTTGPHIHFMVVQDKNNDGNFDDNIPDGLLDPFGWQGSESDPWEGYSFEYNGLLRSGNKSHYLWTDKPGRGTYTLTSDGKKYIVGNSTVEFPMQIVSHDMIVHFQELPPIPDVSIEDIVNGTVRNLSNRLRIELEDGFGNIIKTFDKYLTINIPVNTDDLSRFKDETISIYSSDDGVTWQKESSFFDDTAGLVRTEVNHLTDFMVMGEKVDSLAPVTTLEIVGTEINGSYIPGATISLQATDEPSETSLGVENMYYRINVGEMLVYTEEFQLENEGIYQIEYYSVDGDGNEEQLKETSITVQNPPPQPSPTASAGEATPTMTPTPTVTPASTNTPVPTVNKQPKVHKDKKPKKEKTKKKVSTLQNYVKKLVNSEYFRRFLIVMLNLLRPSKF